MAFQPGKMGFMEGNKFKRLDSQKPVCNVGCFTGRVLIFHGDVQLEPRIKHSEKCWIPWRGRPWYDILTCENRSHQARLHFGCLSECNWISSRDNLTCLFYWCGRKGLSPCWTNCVFQEEDMKSIICASENVTCNRSRPMVSVLDSSSRLSLVGKQSFYWNTLTLSYLYTKKLKSALVAPTYAFGEIMLLAQQGPLQVLLNFDMAGNLAVHRSSTYHLSSYLWREFKPWSARSSPACFT